MATAPARTNRGPSISLLSARELFDLVRDDLAAVETEIAHQNASAIEPVREISDYLLGGGGKRLRPALLLLASRFAGYSGPSAVRLAAVVEMIHTATLIHDDVIDAADTRRGRPSANQRWGNHISVLAGDWLYMQSFQMALQERNFQVLDILIELTQSMVEGELQQWSKLGRMDLTPDQALDLAYCKTAVLFRGCARLGAVLAGENGRLENALAEYGRYSGLAFQLIDDLLDFTASHEQLGKPVLSDLKEGKVTLPLIFALENGNSDGRRLVSTVLQEKGFTTVRPEQITDLVQNSGALDRTRRLAHDYAARAKSALNSAFSPNGSPAAHAATANAASAANGTSAFPSADSDFARALLAVPDFILARDS